MITTIIITTITKKNYQDRNNHNRNQNDDRSRKRSNEYNNNDRNKRKRKSYYTYDNYPKAKEDNQLVNLVRNEDSFEHFINIINNTVLRDCETSKEMFRSRMIDFTRDETKKDAELYNVIREFVHKEIYELDEYKRKKEKESNFRSENRIKDLKPLIVNNYQHTIDRFLDLGCSEGSITAPLGESLQLDLQNIHGCDIFDVKDTKGFIFKKVENQEKLLYEDSYFPVVVALMSLHHMEKLEIMINEIYRVLRPGGLLVIREHNCESGDVSLVMDVVHGFYMQVWKEEKEIEDFRNFYSHYRSSREWKRIIENNGFTELESDDRMSYRKLLRYYYAVYKKK